MSNISATYKRRSIRKFKEDYKISDDTINELLKAGFCSPTAKNSEDTVFIVVKDKDNLEKIQSFHPFSSMLKTASMAILVCGDLNKQFDTDYWIVDSTCSAQNIMIRATELDLGSCFLGVFPNKDRMKHCNALFNLPEHISPLCIIAIGSPDENKLPNNKFDSSRVYFEKIN